MGKAHYFAATGGNIAAGATRNAPLNGILSQNATEIRVQTVVRSPGTFSGMSAYVQTNGTTGATTIYFRVNGANGNQNLSIPAATTGLFQDTTNTDAPVAGDLICYRTVNGGGGNILVQNMSIQFDPSSNTAVRMISTNDAVFSTASVTEYAPLSGSWVTSATEADSQARVRTAGTLKNLHAYVATNARTTTTTCGTRVNGGNGNLIVSIPSTTTGSFEDTTNTDTIASTDLVNYYRTTGSGTGNINISMISCIFETTNNVFQMIGGSTAGVSLTNATRTFAPYSMQNGTVELAYSPECLFAFTIRNLGVYVTSNAATGAGSITARINLVSSSLSASIPAGTTGWFEDTSNSASVAASDTLGIRLVSGSGGAAVYETITMTGETSAPTGTQRVQGFIL